MSKSVRRRRRKKKKKKEKKKDTENILETSADQIQLKSN
jgi:hypothetical protein